MAIHRNLTYPEAIHPAAYIQSTDPSLDATLYTSGSKLWVDTSGSSPVLKYRSADNSAWITTATVGGVGGSGGVLDSTSPVDVASSAVVGSSGSAAHGDHAHRGVHAAYVPSNSFAYGDLTLQGSGDVTVTQSSGSFTFAGTSGSFLPRVHDINGQYHNGMPLRVENGGLGTTTTPTAGALPTGTSGGIYVPNHLIAGSNISITNSSGSVTVSSTGGGGAPTDATYVVSAVNGSLSAEIVIPILASSPDIRVAGTSDDEFDTTDTTDPISGWTTLGTLDTLNTNSDFKSHLSIGRTATGNNLDGIYKAMTPPFVVTARISDAYMLGNLGYPHWGLFIAEATPGKIDSFGMYYVYNSGLQLRQTAWTDRTTQASYNQPGATATPSNKFPIYIRIDVHSSTNVDYLVSNGGYIFSEAYNGSPFKARDPGFTVGAAGIYVCGINSGTLAKACFDWIRFT